MATPSSRANTFGESFTRPLKLQNDDGIKKNRFIPSRIEEITPHHSNFSSLPPSRADSPVLVNPSEEQQDPRHLLDAVNNLMKTRNGSVLSRNTILKMDHFEKGVNTKLDFHLQGAPNFRVADLNVYGVAQPTAIGLSTVLALLNCHPKSNIKTCCTWFLTREEPLIYLNGNPYVLRDYADPLSNMVSFLGINATRLEKLEGRLKADVIKEAKNMGGLILVHQELSDGSIVPCFIAADQVVTPKELFEEYRRNGYRLSYFRIPISPEQAPEDNYFDEYVRVIKTLKPTDPLIFNCGMGVVRTTMGIIMAQIIRRAQLLESNYADPFPIAGYNYTVDVSNDRTISPELFKGWEEVDSQAQDNHALLRLVYILEQGLDSKMSPRSAIEWALERGNMIEDLKKAIMGNYTVISALAAVLDGGDFSKRMLDQVIDQSDAVINLREDILMNRIKQTTKPESNSIAKAAVGLQRYFSLLCFTSYINESPDTAFDETFSSWVRHRSEIWTMLQSLRKSQKLYLFRPVEDLHRLVHVDIRSASHHRRFGPGMFDIGIDLAPEMQDVILKSRTGVVLTPQTILKIDSWNNPKGQQEHHQLQKLPTPGADDVEEICQKPQRHHVFLVEGGSNFRRIKHTHVYGIAQPTVDGLRTVLRKLLTNQPKHEKILWINLREEPIIYINGIPYVLRDRYFTLRNIKVYKGITGSRLEQLETRLKQDIIREILNYDGHILLHGEDEKGNVLTAWEQVNTNDVMTVREVMHAVASEYQEFDSDSESTAVDQKKDIVDYYRVPITAEKPPEWCDFDEIKNLVSCIHLAKTAIIVNCQVGLGRSTLGTVAVTLMTRWLKHDHSQEDTHSKCHYLNYQVINSLLRVVQNGLEIKRVVDTVIDKCGAFLNLREMIESEHLKSENEKDANKRLVHVKRGVAALQRYFVLLCFQAYLDCTSPDDSLHTDKTFEAWMKKRPEIGRLLQEFNHDHDESLIVPVEKSIGDGVALSSEIMSVVTSRHGQVLAQQTILKHDAFPGCQKMSLKEKIDEAYNFRRVQVKQAKLSVKIPTVAADLGGLMADLEYNNDQEQQPPFICGCAMPSKDAIKSVLKSMHAGPGGKRTVLWTCLREEPVLYINKQPYVLRLFQDPLKNLESTGITTDRVESMEERMKQEAINEWKEYGGRLLLHDEKPNDKGEFELMGLWESLSLQEIETPKETFQSIIDQGYQVDYMRIPVTDEQAPLPMVFDQLIMRTKGANTGVDMLYNCQMGRGRTTTGMVTACLIAMILNNDCILQNTRESISLESPTATRTIQFENSESEQDSLQESYHNGEFKIILQLVGMLTYGKRAKRLTDKAINMCDHMQNLRTVIYDYKLRMDAMEETKAYKSLKEVAMNYLIRYFYLIVFANYLLEELDLKKERGDDTCQDEAICDGMDKAATFQQWLSSRREITNILKLQVVELA